MLPINNLPEIAPIQVQTSSVYIGADAQTVEDTVSTVIERQVNGVEGMQYMTSTSGNDGSSTISTLFDPASNRNINQVNVQNRAAIAQEIIAKANQNPALRQVFTQFTASTPQYQIDIDRDRLEALDVDFSQAMNTLGAYMGGQYVNDFTFSQRSYRVYIQADEQFRNSPDNIGQINVRSRGGNLVLLNEVAKVTPITGPQTISHFNLFRAIKIQGSAAPGYSSGQAIAAMQQTFKEIEQPGLGYDWTGLSREETKSGGQA